MVSYARPILVEIAATLRYGPEILLAPHILEASNALVKRGFGEAQIDITADPTADGPGLMPTVKLWWPGHKRLVQLREHSCIVNLVGEYPGWGVFAEHMGLALAGLRDAGVDKRPEGLALVTIDRFSVPASGFRLGDYLIADGTRIPTLWADAAEPCDINLGRGVVQSSGRNRALKVAARAVGDRMEVTVEAKFENSLSGADAVIGTLDALHDESTATFEELITAKTRRDIMGGPT